MRVRYSMVDSDSYLAKCDLTEKQARNLFNNLKDEKYCVWAELVAEEDEEGGYMEILDSFEHEHAYEQYKVEQEMRGIVKELFG